MRTRRTKSSSDPALSQSAVRPKTTALQSLGHKPVLLHEVLRELAIVDDDIVVDATLGGAGHALEIARALGARGTFVGLDADEEAVARAREALAGTKPRVQIAHANFSDIASVLHGIGIEKVNKVLFDLGWSGYQLQSGRGFSFLSDEPLLMAYDSKANGLTARTIVNDWGEGSIADIIFGFGEERYARKIAHAIHEAREKKPIETARELGEIVKEAVPAAYRHGRIHPATKTFQALRIVVNDEFGAIENGLAGAWKLLGSGGRIAVITFHSVEDRLVKRIFRQFVAEGVGALINKHVIVASRDEVVANPRARSAKLRVIQKL